MEAEHWQRVIMEYSDEEVAGRFRAGERDRGVRLDLFLKRQIPKLTRHRIQEAIATRVHVPGRARVRPSLSLRPGDEVVVLRVAPEPGPFSFEPEILHHDSDLVVVSKPAGVPVHATRRIIRHHLIGWLRERLGPELALAHRLDRETSGVVVATRNAAAARKLARAFATGRVRKEYLALVFGSPPRSFEVDLNVGSDRGSAVHIKQAAGVERGQSAVTRFEVERYLGRHALVRARPLTGRRHQIRVHLAAAGHPLVGDKLYARGERHFLNFIARGPCPGMLSALGAPRHLLHAARLGLDHPRDGAALVFEAPLPSDMAAFIEQQVGP